MKGLRWLFLMLWLPSIAFAAFDKGVQYQELDVKQISASAATAQLHREHPGKLYLIEFFSYGCHWCHDFEPHLQTWLKPNAKNVVFVRVPVVFHPSWKILAKAYFVASMLNISNKMDPVLFQYVYEQKSVPENDEALRQLFVKNGIKAKAFDEIYYSKALNEQLKWAESMVELYQVRMVPTLILHSETENYSTNTQMGGSFDNMLTGIAGLIKAHNAPIAP